MTEYQHKVQDLMRTFMDTRYTEGYIFKMEKRSHYYYCGPSYIPGGSSLPYLISKIIRL